MPKKWVPVERPTGLLLYKNLASLPSDWRAPNVGELPDWPINGRVGIDVETKDPDLKTLGPGVRRSNSRLAGISFAIEGGPSTYLPLSHEGGDNVLDPGRALAYMAAQAKRFRGVITGANLGYDLDWLAQYDVDFLTGPCQARDVQVAAPLINELFMSYSLDNIAKRLGFDGKDEALLQQAAELFRFNTKSEMWRLPARYVGPYATMDAKLPLQILRKQEDEIESQDLWQIFQLECAVQKVLTKLRRRGILIDQDQLAKVEEWALTEETKAVAEVHRLSGIELGVDNCMKAAMVAPIFDKLGIKYALTEKTKKPKIDKDALDGIDHPMAEALAWARKTNKLRTTFVASIRTHMVNGRIHTTFNQLRKTKEFGETVGATYGRLSSERPNLQQQPSRDSFAPMWRAIYLPEPGSTWAALDYSQQEPRWTVHFAEEVGLPRADIAADAYRNDPNTDNHQMMADMAGIERKAAKEFFLGLTYGMGGAKLCRKLGLPTRWGVFPKEWGEFEPVYYEHRWQAAEHNLRDEDTKFFEVAGEEGQGLLNRFNAQLPFLKKLSRKCQDAADANGDIITVLGRKCRFPKVGAHYDWTHKALNRLIQGSSADQTKKALVEADNAGHYLQLQVHDELDGSFENEAEARSCAQLMVECVPARVPFKVDIDMGPNWGDAVDIDKEAA